LNSLQRWVSAPKTHLLNKTLFQIHLWAGIALGLYILMISVSGAAYLLENDLDRYFVPGNVQPTAAGPLPDDELEARIEEVYSDSEVFMFTASSNPERAVLVVLRQETGTVTHYFDQYRGLDQGSSLPWQAKAYRWLIDFHDDLFIENGGRQINGWGAVVFLVMMLSGLFIWWRGKAQWHQGLYLSNKSPRGTLWQLHSVFGFWCLFFMFAWGVSGMLISIPDTFRTVTDTLGLSDILNMGLIGMADSEIQTMLDSGELEANAFIMNLGEIRADRSSGILDFMVDIHFGRFEAAWTKWALLLISLIPAAMFITGFILWWKRVVTRTYRKVINNS
jgi:uncharacterized iron-regulated membrane protein